MADIETPLGKAMSKVIEMKTVTRIRIYFVEPEPDYGQNSFVRTTEQKTPTTKTHKTTTTTQQQQSK